jgi:uncharacterized membrane protein
MAASTRITPSPPRHPANSTRKTDRPVNVGDLERCLSLLGGGLLALCTIRRSLGTVVLLGGAGALLYRGWTGHCALYQTLGCSTASQELSPAGTRGVSEPDEPPLVVLVGS